VHLSMCDSDARLGYDFADAGRHLIDSLGPDCGQIDLTVAVHFSQDRLPDQVLVEIADEGLDGKAIFRWSLDVLRSRTPVRLMCRVRGMGVAVRVRTSPRSASA